MFRGAACLLLLASACVPGTGVIRDTDDEKTCSADIECARKPCVHHRCSCDEDADCPRGRCNAGACTKR